MPAIRMPCPVTPTCAHESFVARREQRLERAAGRHGRLPLVGLDEVVQLDQVDVIDIHPLQ